MTPTAKAVEIIHDATCRDNQHDGPESGYPCVELAREVLAAGQVEPRTITQVEQLETLPEGTFLRIAGWVYLLHEGKWYLVNTRDMTLGTQSVLGGRIGLNHIGLRLHLPATVLTAQPAISAEQVEAMARSAHDRGGCQDPYGVCVSTSQRYREWATADLRAAGVAVAGEN